ncbi:hypothetical protein HYH02_006334 [Chlamydomonas schloesseri]|uniref:U6 small nuclear RNA (adenine-(43)-N(6))-methyltransferase n=1 Tax=Chlamydomonas schloesseri TaxID=2026947 RepID=A0A835WJB9_9CHLO|nr:hypothetical protein HYH02_006334 [Chlamydomonas schloesseri]|eukprot:KAG2448442.1 hypothetical protein HYH02_006334 [Chlamydomonas schloesseri]
MEDAGAVQPTHLPPPQDGGAGEHDSATDAAAAAGAGAGVAAAGADVDEALAANVAELIQLVGEYRVQVAEAAQVLAADPDNPIAQEAFGMMQDGLNGAYLTLAEHGLTITDDGEVVPVDSEEAAARATAALAGAAAAREAAAAAAASGETVEEALEATASAIAAAIAEDPAAANGVVGVVATAAAAVAGVLNRNYAARRYEASGPGQPTAQGPGASDSAARAAADAAAMPPPRTVAGGGGAAAASAAATQPRGGAAGNARMHPANHYYRAEPDFGALAERYEELRPYVTVDANGRAHLETTSWAATRALTACLLRADFGLSWWLPEGQLVPPVTNRANYLHWINDLLDLSAPQEEYGGTAGELLPLRGLDIGCGANFIYCLLGAALYGWHMTGVDVTATAVRCCGKLIADNPQLASLLEVRDLSHLHPDLQRPSAAAPLDAARMAGGRRGRKRTAAEAAAGPADAAADAAEQQDAGDVAAAGQGAEEGSPDAAPPRGKGAGAHDAEVTGSANLEVGILFPVFADGEETFAFTMCNPPFFESMAEAARNPNTAFGGTAAEMVCPGGELAFVLQMVAESEELQDRVHWFTTMVGKKDTLKAVKKELHSRHITQLRTTELAQGKTSRWAVAWSWQVDPNKAMQPLRRLEETGLAAGPPAAAAGGGGAAAGVTAGSAAGVARAARQQALATAATGPTLAAAGLQVLPRRHVGFTVQKSGVLDGRVLLQRLQALLQEGGGAPVTADLSRWSLTWPLQMRPTGGEGPSGSAAGSGLLPTGITARLMVAQQQRGRVEVVASIPNTAPDTAARAFAGLMAELEAAVTAEYRQ